MKSILPLLVVPVLAAFVLVGCNQYTPSDSTGTQSTNSSVNNGGSMSGGFTNVPATNSLSGIDTNMPASTNQ